MEGVLLGTWDRCQRGLGSEWLWMHGGRRRRGSQVVTESAIGRLVQARAGGAWGLLGDSKV